MNTLVDDLNLMKMNLLTYSEIVTAVSAQASSYLAQSANMVSAAIQQIQLEKRQKKDKEAYARTQRPGV
jgi:hypothetical protein